ncbi:regulatory iron-sulfur-containing complex subunit RicT [Hydrogenobacter sp. T-2]|uniref:PSP1 domain-containing protein n=1 Tax=Pampinifervens diazotrophicum TaxID=1632018 RepID=UPI002B25A520|nr:regulatory iron-sulfur-containing complex subunit RicT [Hydrogenobacter sp. T-2]WPM32017.1 regulatory iron-sulfur-containing complex subunit RicT [Hydrogenobacter sp. T-2]
MSYIKAKFKDTNKVLQVEGVWEKDVSRGELLVVQSEKGEEVVRVLGTSKEPSSYRAIFLRKAKREDIQRMEENEEKAKEAMAVCKKKIIEHGLDMKLIKTYIPLDKSKIFFYYTSDHRVDFRNLVRDLAKIFKKRIEMRQVGVRDAVQMLGWVGACGDMPCCIRFQEEFQSVSLRDIEEQNLPLSPQKFTGPCGRLMCCLVFERENYLIKSILPEAGSELCYGGKVYKVLHVDPIKWKISLVSEDSKKEIDLEDVLPGGYEKALKHCQTCGGCCRRASVENEAFAGIE